MYVCIDISLFQFVLLCFDFFFMKMRADEKYIKSHVYLPDITLPYLLTVYELHNFIPFCYLNTEQMKNVDPLFSKSQCFLLSMHFSRELARQKKNQTQRIPLSSQEMGC